MEKKSLILGHKMTDEEYNFVMGYMNEFDIEKIKNDIHRNNRIFGAIAGCCGLALSGFVATVNLPVGIASLVVFAGLWLTRGILNTRGFVSLMRKAINEHKDDLNAYVKELSEDNKKFEELMNKYTDETD